MSLQEAFEKTKTELTVSQIQLMEITHHFIYDLRVGLNTTDPRTIPMNPTWVMDVPDGSEVGEYLAIDFGGTNLRVIRVELHGSSKYSSVSEKYPIPAHMRTGTSQELFGFIARTLHGFVITQGMEPKEGKLPLGFTFSYATTQTAINNGILQTWTKGFDIAGVEGHDVIPLLQHALDDCGAQVEVVALINDTTGTLVASRYCDPEAHIGCIFGTGVNGAYYEKVSNIGTLKGKLPDDIAGDDSVMAINCEYGAFDNKWGILPRTVYDLSIDCDSPRPGEQLYEKMISGYYLGEILRLVLIHYYSEDLMFKGQNVEKLMVPFSMDSSYLSLFELYSEVKELKTCIVVNQFKKSFDIDITPEEKVVIHKLSVLIGTRSARLSATAIAAIALQNGIIEGHCACDGSVFNKYPNFKERVMDGLTEIFHGFHHPLKISLVHAEDGSGVGAAIIACLTQKRMLAGKSVGMIPT